MFDRLKYKIQNIILFLKREPKWFLQRGRYGVADGDVWNLGYYISGVLARGMRKLAKDSFGFPYDGTDQSEFKTQKEWDDWLNDRASWLERYSQDKFEWWTPEGRKELDHFYDVVLPDIVQHWGTMWN